MTQPKVRRVRTYLSPEASAVTDTAGTVTIDTREPKSLQLSLGKRLAPRDTRLATLAAGDLRIDVGGGGALGIERKAVSDFLGSLGGKQANGRARLYNQLEKLAASYQTTVLLIEGTWTAYAEPRSGVWKVRAGQHDTRWSVAAMQCAMLALQQRCPTVQVLWTPDQPETIETIRALAERVRVRGPNVHAP